MTNAIALILATALLVLIPGPNAALIVANSLKYGLRSGLVTVAGTTTGIAVQLLLVVAGMAAVIGLAASALAWIKWAGVAYLLYLGVRTWNEPADDLAQIGPQKMSGAFWRGAFLAIVNPKTLLFNAAFLPQFVSGTADVNSQLSVLTVIFLTVIAIGDAMWALAAVSARAWLRRSGSLRNKLTGGFLVGAGVGLALSRRTA